MTLATAPRRNKATSADADPVAQAQREKERWFVAESKWSSIFEARQAQLADLQQTAGRRLAAASFDNGGEDSAKGLGVALAALEAECQSIDRAIDATRAERLTALEVLLPRAEAAVRRERAAELRAEADQRQAKTDELLAQLHEWEGVAYAPRPPRPPEGPSPRLRDGQAVVTGGGPRIVLVPTPKTELLRSDAARLEREADAVLARKAKRDGHIELRLWHAEILERSAAPVATEFVTRATKDHDVIAPKIPAIRAAITDQFTREQARRARMTEDDLQRGTPTFFELSFRGSTIVEKETRARLGVIHRVTMEEGSTTKIRSVEEWR